MFEVAGGEQAVARGEAGWYLVGVQDGVPAATNIRFSLARWRIVAIQPSPTARVGAIQRSTPCAYRWNLASGM